jgi:uncharacterized protein YhdP
VRIDDLSERPVLQVVTRAEGPAAQMLAYVQRSPVNGFLGGALARSRMGGQARLDLRLGLPLYNLGDIRLNGQVRFPGNDVLIQPAAPELRQASGLLEFSESGFQVREARATVYGGELRFEGGLGPATQDPAGARLRFTGQGTATAQGLRDGDLGLVSRLFQTASGSTVYSGELQFRGGVPELRLRSDLRGLAVDLPAPLGKTADQPLALRYENSAGVIVGEMAETDRLALDIGPPEQPLLSLAYDRAVDGGRASRAAGRIGLGLDVGESVALPSRGVQANIRLAEVDVDAWQRVFAGTASSAASPTAGAAAGTDERLDYLPTTLAVRADRLSVGGRSFNRVVAGGSREGSEWRANIDAEQLNGYVAYQPSDAGTPGTCSPACPGWTSPRPPHPRSSSCSSNRPPCRRWTSRSRTSSSGAGRWGASRCRPATGVREPSASGGWTASSSRPIPARAACSACSACRRCPAAWCSISATSSPRASPSISCAAMRAWNAACSPPTTCR